jgi:hypothetical protein
MAVTRCCGQATEPSTGTAISGQRRPICEASAQTLQKEESESCRPQGRITATAAALDPSNGVTSHEAGREDEPGAVGLVFNRLLSRGCLRSAVPGR